MLSAPLDFAPGAKLFCLTIDFSKHAVGAILSHKQKGKDRFLGVKGRKCRPYECNYHSSKGEMLALVYGLDKFSHFLRLSKFVVITDSNTVLHWGTSILERFSFVVQNITARDPHTRLKNLKQILAVFYDFFKAANSKLYGSYLSDFEIVVHQFLLIKIYT